MRVAARVESRAVPPLLVCLMHVCIGRPAPALAAPAVFMLFVMHWPPGAGVSRAGGIQAGGGSDAGGSSATVV